MTGPWLAEARAGFHRACLDGPVTRDASGLVSLADSSSRTSRDIAFAMAEAMGGARLQSPKPPGQQAGNLFEEAVCDFVASALQRLSHLRPGRFSALRHAEISAYEQYAHLDELRALADGYRALKTLIGSDYLIKPDIVVIRAPATDAEINAAGPLVDTAVGALSPLRQANGARDSLHASISCKLTIRSDRVQNTRSEALNLIRNRKGALPHIAAVTAEPQPGRIAAIALGTGDMDCVYHAALPELSAVIETQPAEMRDLMATMIEGKRLRDIADLPLDLVL